MRFFRPTRMIPLIRGQITRVAERNYPDLAQFNWCVTENPTSGKLYAVRSICDGSIIIGTEYMHRRIMHAPPWVEVDHKDGDGLNNVYWNLRLCTHSQNLSNRGKQQNNTSGYKGVSWYQRGQRWVAHIKAGKAGKNIHLGYFDDPVEAALAYDRAALQYHGAFSSLNFPAKPQGRRPSNFCRV
jgi:hypothetical protein